jgi:D-arabinose 1-dehydrogenase-like Zn-dependent alcohol dehydrogenase
VLIRCWQDTNKCQIDEIPVPNITDDEILVKVGSASLCHSDLMLFDGSLPADKPVVIGHEGVGYVENVGKNVTGFQKGDRIGFLYIKGCCCESFSSIVVICKSGC